MLRNIVQDSITPIANISVSPSVPLTVKSPSAALVTRVILVRHGRSTFNEQGRYQGSSDDAVLTEQGRKTAAQTAIALQGIQIDAIYSSPLKRVKETLYKMLSILGENPNVYTSAQLREIDMPDWEGLSFQQVRDQFSENYRRWKQHPHELQMAIDSEETPFFPVLNLYDRAQQFWQTILPRHIGQTLLIVSHGGTNHALISTALGLSPENHHTIQQSNCGISVLEFSQGDVKVRSLNNTQHLGETLPKLKEGKQGLRLLLVPMSDQMAETEAIAQSLKDNPIQFSLSIATEPCQQTVDQILSHHPQAVQLQTQREDFAQTWQRSLAQQRQPAAKVITGLIVATPATLQSLLAQAMQHRSPSIIPLTEQIHLQPKTFSVLHYPSIHHPPILQSLNFGQDLSCLIPSTI
jgi:phosphoserine phosphatase